MSKKKYKKGIESLKKEIDFHRNVKLQKAILKKNKNIYFFSNIWVPPTINTAVPINTTTNIASSVLYSLVCLNEGSAGSAFGSIATFGLMTPTFGFFSLTSSLTAFVSSHSSTVKSTVFVSLNELS